MTWEVVNIVSTFFVYVHWYINTRVYFRVQLALLYREILNYYLVNHSPVLSVVLQYSGYSPCTAEFPGLIPDLLHVGVVLDNDRVFHVTAAGGGRPVRPCCVVVRRWRHAAAVEVYFECGTEVSSARLQVHTVRVAVKPCKTWNNVVDWLIDWSIDRFSIEP